MTDYFANMVISERALYGDGQTTWPTAELRRVLRPYGGLLWLDPAGRPFRRGPLAGAGSWTHQFGNPGNTANSNDQRVQRDVDLQWFGGPGPGRMVDRHLRSHAPLVSNGILIVPGENMLIGVDAYNGVELWSLSLPKSHRYSMPYDAGYIGVEGDLLAIAVGESCWLIDIQTGLREQELPLDALNPEFQGQLWGYTALVEGCVIGAAHASEAVRRTPSRRLIDLDYRNETPVATSDVLFSYSIEKQSTVWNCASGVIINSTIVIAEDRIVLVEALRRFAA